MRREPPLPFRHQVVDGFLPQGQVRLLFAEAFDFRLIGPLVGLCPGAVHGGTFAAVEHAELDAGGVDGLAHGPAEGVDFADDLSLGHAADGRIAAHLGDGVEVAGQQRGLCPHAGRGQGRLAARMSAADDQNVVVVGIAHGAIISGSRPAAKRILSRRHPACVLFSGRRPSSSPSEGQRPGRDFDSLNTCGPILLCRVRGAGAAGDTWRRRAVCVILRH